MREPTIRTRLATAVALAIIVPAAPAAGQSLNAHISRLGTDSGTCSVGGAPCRTLLYALGRVVDGGSIVCVDSGVFSFGNLSITKSITVDCSAATGIVNGPIVISDSGADSPGGRIKVVLRGLQLLSSTDAVGIDFVAGFSLSLDRVSVTNYTGAGIRFSSDLAARLNIVNSTIQNIGGTGILIRPDTAGYASVTLDNVQLTGNPSNIVVNTSDARGRSTNVVITRSAISGGDYGVSVEAPSGASGAGVTVTGTAISGNAIAGLFANGALAQIRIGTSTIAGNSTGVQTTNGGVIATYGNNTLIGNGVNGSFNGFPTEN